MRALLFTVWVYAGKSATGTISTLEALAIAQYETVTHGGARMVRASLSGKSFDYEMPANWGPTDFIESVRLAYKQVLTGGAAGQMTEAELMAYVLDSDNEQTDTMTVRVNNLRYGR